MGQVKDIACSVWRRLKGAAASLCSAVTGPARGAHSAHGDLSAPDPAPAPTPAPRARGARPARARSSRGAHTASSRRRRVIAARGAHSAPRAPRPSVPVNLNTAPAAARGYSMAEVLATVAIILILGSLVVMNVVSFQANLRQKALDAKAEIIYTAAQEQMTRIMASGRDDVFAAPPAGQESTINEEKTASKVAYIPAVNAVPGDYTEDNPDEYWKTCYISSADLNAPAVGGAPSAASLLFGNGGLDDELLNNHWIVEYDSSSLTVHAVYYSEDFDCTSEAAYSDVANNYSKYYNNELRNRAMRLKSESYLGTGRHVGYHGGSNSSAKAAFSLNPAITHSNAEKLTVTVKCSKPLISEDVAFLVTLEDSFGNTHSAVYCMDTDEEQAKALYTKIPVYASSTLGGNGATDAPNARFGYYGLDYTLELTLDSLEKLTDENGVTSLRFTDLYGSSSYTAKNPTATDNKPLVEGSDINVKVEAFCLKNTLIEPGFADYDKWSTDKINSLFDGNTVIGDATQLPAEPGTAGISACRHLQNLDSASGVKGSRANICSVEQHASIDFAKDTDGDTAFKGWKSTYGSNSNYFYGLDAEGTPRFKPIENSQITSYRGTPLSAEPGAQPYSIAHLNISEQGSAAAGLFRSVEAGSTLSILDTALTGAKVSGGGAVGGMVGSSAGALHIENSQHYLNPFLDPPAFPSEDPSAWLAGSSAGGLVGTVTGGSLTIKKSSASTVVHGAATGVAGGLVGSASGCTPEITNSYADCYLKGNKTGGLVGSGNASVSGSYSAGFLAGMGEGPTAAGMVNGGGSIHNSYTVCTTYGNTQLNSYYRTFTGTDIGNTYYLVTDIKGNLGEAKGAPFTDKSGTEGYLTPSDLNTAIAAEGTAFTIGQMSHSEPYNLMDQGLENYDWPSIADIYHYGDWSAGFIAGSLVYFEKYRVVDESGHGKTYCYGFTGANVKSTLISASKIDPAEGIEHLWEWKAGKWNVVANDSSSTEKKRIIVVGDGYGVVYKKGSAPTSNVVIQMPGTGNRTSWDVIANIEIAKDEPLPVKSYKDETATSGEEYMLYPLDTTINNTHQVNVETFCLSATIGADNYFFNPHFAKTVRRANASEKPTKPTADGHPYSHIILRTGRHLNNLSLYYDRYRTATENCTFSQERDIAFTDYQWDKFAGKTEGTVLTSQGPIGTSADKPFVATYDGGCNMITDVSFVTEGHYAGLFGYVDSTAQVKNVVLCTDYKPVDPNGSPESDENALASLSHNYYVQRNVTNSNKKGDIYMGVLAGYNAGTVTNCATAGYFLAGQEGTVNAYYGSTVRLGGLVGANRGSIKNCAADSPKLRLSIENAGVYAGGFAGSNEGTVRNSYALGAIDVVYAAGSEISVAGFAGTNSGQITDSYSATAIASSGLDTVVNGFAPAGGRVSSSTFLNGGTYTYISRMYAFSFTTDKHLCAGDPIRYDDLKLKQGGAGYVDEGHSFVHSQTKTEVGNDHYPYRGIVVDKNEEHVHYGNWQDDVVLGNMGVFYWELEESSANSGYHMTYLGNNESYIDGAWKPAFSGGTSLCNSHDDGGVITEYGYGVYVRQGEEAFASFSWSGIACSSDALTTAESKVVSMDTLNNNTSLFNAAASEQLQEQMENTDTGSAKYRFFAFTTRVNKGAEDTGNYLYLDKPDGKEQNGSVTLTFDSPNSGEEGGGQQRRASYTYNLSPFFANALSLTNVNVTNGSAGKPGKLSIKAFDDRVIDCLEEPGFIAGKTNKGGGDNHYEVRSLQQLQYINWCARDKSTDELVDSTNYKRYPYLQYTTITSGNGHMTRDNAEKASNGRVARSWLQTHDLQNAGDWNKGEDSLFAPIAGAGTSSTANNYDAYLYAWFGGSYNGQSYTIRDVTVKTKSFYVGVFAATAGAEVRNVILRGDTDRAVIERDTSSDDPDGAYCIGSLAGTTFNYKGEEGAIDKTITNCAVSGYEVVDSSRNRQGKGEVCIGGLIGIANVNLRNCSAVTDIKVQPDYRGKHTNDAGNYIRVGGLVGGLLDSVENCYTGGRIEVGEAVLNEALKGEDSYADPTMEEKLSWTVSTRVFLAGIAGTPFSSSVKNFGLNINSGHDSFTMHIYNSYTYMKFPAMERTICSISMIGSLADRHSLGNKPVIDNCYYLDTSAVFDIKLPSYYYHTKKVDGKDVNQTLPHLFTDGKSGDEGQHAFDEKKKAMINGDVRYLASYLGKNNGPTDTDPTKPIADPPESATPLTFQEMNCLEPLPGSTGTFIDMLNKQEGAEGRPTTEWAPVTVTDKNGIEIDGKYSFAKNEALDGKNYPFPTIVTQRDQTFSEDVHVHYGDWPIVGSHWLDGRGTLDIFTDMNRQDGNGVARKVFTLLVDPSKYEAGQLPNAMNEDLYEIDKDYAEIVSITKHTQTIEGYEDFLAYDVTIEAKKEGYITVSFNKAKEPGASFLLHITANWNLTAEVSDESTAFDPVTNTLFIRKDVSYTGTLKLGAQDSTGKKKLTGGVEWDENVSVDEPGRLKCELEDNPVQGAILKVTRLEDGPAVITLSASYTYRKGQSDQQVYSNQLFITAEMPGMIGLSNRIKGTDDQLPSPRRFNEVELGGKEPNGKDKTYVDTEGPKPGFSSPRNFFLYTAKKNSILDSSSIVKSVVVNDGVHGAEALESGKVSDDNSNMYYLELDKAAAVAGDYSCLAGAVYYLENAPANDLSVTVTLQGNYVLKTMVPANSVTRAKLFTLTLDKGGAGTKEFILNAKTNTVPGYNVDDFKYRKGMTDWMLEGWYTSNDGKGTQVLDTNGKIAETCPDLEGIIEGDHFARKGKVTLYAKWTHKKTAWVLCNGVPDVGTECLIVSSAAPGSTGMVFHQDGKQDTTFTGRGTYLKSDYVAISNDGYIEGDFDASYVWEAARYVDGTAKVTGLRNKMHSDAAYPSDMSKQYFFAENDDNCWGKWSALATNNVLGRKESKLTDRVEIVVNENGSLRTKSANLNFYLDTANLIADGSDDSKRIFLFKKIDKDDLDAVVEESFSYYPELKLYNGSRELRIPLASQTGHVDGADLTARDWRLAGWYSSKSNNASRVLNADGTVVNAPMDLQADLALYAKWIKTSNQTKPVKVDPASEDSIDFSGSSEYVIVDTIASMVPNKDSLSVNAESAPIGYHLYADDSGISANTIGTKAPQRLRMNGNKDSFTMSFTARKDNVDHTYFIVYDQAANKLVLRQDSPGEATYWKLTSGFAIEALDSEGNGTGKYISFVHKAGSAKPQDGTWTVAASPVRELALYKHTGNLHEFSWDRK